MGSEGVAFVRSHFNAWSQSISNEIRILGILMVAVFFLPWIIGDDSDVGGAINGDEPTSVAWSWDIESTYDQIEDEMDRRAKYLERRGEEETAELYEDFKVPTTMSPTYLLIMGLFLVAFGYIPNIPRNVQVGAALVAVLLWFVLGNLGISDMGTLVTRGKAADLAGRMQMLSFGLILAGFAGALLRFGEKGWSMARFVSAGSVLLVFLALILPLKLEGSSKPFIGWVFHGIKEAEDWALVLMLLALVICLIIAALAVISALITFVFESIGFSLTRPNDPRVEQFWAHKAAWGQRIQNGAAWLMSLALFMLFVAIATGSEGDLMIIGLLYLNYIAKVHIVWLFGFVALFAVAIYKTVEQMATAQTPNQ